MELPVSWAEKAKDRALGVSHDAGVEQLTLQEPPGVTQGSINSPHLGPSLVSAAVIKHCEQKHLGKRGFISPYTSQPATHR